MTTGTVQSASITLSKHRETKLVTLTLTNGEGAELLHGQEVYVTGDLTVSKRDLVTQIPVGIVSIGGLDTALVSIATSFQRTLKFIATGGTLAAGSEAKPNGLLTGGVPQYVAAAALDHVSAVVLQGATVGNEGLLGIMRSSYVK